MATSERTLKIGITENVLKTLGDIGKSLADCAGSSGDLLPPSPPTEKATARQDQVGQASAN